MGILTFPGWEALPALIRCSRRRDSPSTVTPSSRLSVVPKTTATSPKMWPPKLWLGWTTTEGRRPKTRVVGPAPQDSVTASRCCFPERLRAG